MLKIDDRDLRLALKHLPAIDCTFVANWLVAQAPLDHERGYLLGSLVAQGCKTDRARNLELLAREAKDPFVRVAGGVALLDLDKTKGEPLVRAASKGGDTPAIWAQLTLAQRGDTASAAALITAFAHRETGSRAWNRDSLLTRFLVLLSNSAANSKLPQPPLGAKPEQLAKPLQAWWAKHEKQLRLADPWIAELDALDRD